MKAMRLERVGRLPASAPPLALARVPTPEPGAGQVRVRVARCGVCHTELDEIEGRLSVPTLPRILGHQAIGRVDSLGTGVDTAWQGARVGVAWIAGACGHCRYCQSGRENLCPNFVARGLDVDGGYAEYLIADPDFVHRIPAALETDRAAPLLCAGAIGFRALELTALADGERLGLTGFGSSGQLTLKMARVRYPSSPVYVFARDANARALAESMGAAWTGGTDDRPPDLLDAIIDTTPAWQPIVRALERLAPGGRVVVNAIRKESADKQALTELDYARDLWRERSLRSVANVTRHDVRACLDLAADHGIAPEVDLFPLEEANEAMAALKAGTGRASRVLVTE